VLLLQEVTLVSVRVILADRHPVILQGLHSLLAAEKDFKIVCSCRSALDCVDAIRSFRPHIALVDMFLPDATTREILAVANRFRTRVIFLAEAAEDCEQVLAIARGAYGVLLKDAVPAVLLQSLRQVASGHKLLPAGTFDNLSDHQSSDRNGSGVMSHLTSREHQIVHFVSEGLSNKAIGRRLKISDGTIKVHLHHIYQKLGTSNRATLVALALSGVDGDRPQRRRLPGEA
jgi:DNA-binding NarL/FixJ family response regulator